MPFTLPASFPIHLFVAVRFLLAPWLGRMEVRALRQADAGKTEADAGKTGAATGTKLRYYKRFCLGNLVSGTSCWAMLSLMPHMPVHGGILLGLPFLDWAKSFAIGGGVGGILGEGIELLLLRRKNSKGVAKRRRIYQSLMYSMPATRQERRWFVLVSCMAGYGEELCYRAFLIAYLVLFFGLHAGWALLVTSIVFGLAHLSQGYRSAIRITLVGYFFGMAYLGTGHIWYAMLLHALFNLRILPELRLLGLAESDEPDVPPPDQTPPGATLAEPPQQLA